MRDARYFNIALIAAVVVVIFAGTYSVLHPPVPKPAPEAPVPSPSVPVPSEPAPQAEELPQFDAGKYRAEPSVSIYRADKGTIERLPLEVYLEGVVAQEMEPDWPIEALEAQAIVARTLTISAMEADTIKRLRGTDVSTAKEELQAYAPKKVNNNVREAVKRSRGKILLYQGSLVNAIYSSCNGQIAATKEESFPVEIAHPTPYFQPVTDNCFQYAPANIQSWEIKIAGTEVAAAVGYKGNPGDVQILEKGPSGRILYIGAGNKKVYGSDFREKIGFDKLKSTLITEMNYDGKYFIIKGLGWGNGVGLCQWGAYTYARQGMAAEDIVLHYYVGAEIKKLWE